MSLAIAIDETYVVARWERQILPAVSLARLGISVVFRGVPSDAGGPDYQDVLLALHGRTTIAGDVEFHVRSSDWYRHGHDRNPAFNRVILHVVCTDDGPTTYRADGAAVPVLAVGTDALDGMIVAHEGARQLLPNPCVASFAAHRTDNLMAVVRTLGIERFEQRAARFESEMACLPPDEVAYRAILEAMGFASNRAAFIALAEAVPYGWLMSVPERKREETFLCAAGLGGPAIYDPPARISPSVWRLARLRPANQPTRRLSGVVRLLQRLGSPLADALSRAVDVSEKPRHLRMLLTVAGDESAYIGEGRADELAVSVVLPFVRALHADDGRALQLYSVYPSPPENRWTRHMLSLFDLAGHEVRIRHAVEHQGLHHLYHTHCRTDATAGCAVCRTIC